MYKVLFINDSSEKFSLINNHNLNHRLYYTIRNLSAQENISSFISEHHTDLIILSCTINNSEKDHYDIIRELKLNSLTNHIPVLVCTKKETAEEQVKYLDQGADDVYRTKDSLELLFSKMNAILRKMDLDKNVKVNIHRKFFFIDDSLEVEHLGVRHKLTNKEFAILKTLVDHPGKVFSQEDLNKITSGEGVFVTRRCIDTFITLLRKKIGKECIICIRKKGYKLNDQLFGHYDENPQQSVG